MFAISLSDFLHTLGSFGQRFHGLLQEGIYSVDLGTNGLPQGVQKGIKQPLDVVINYSLHWVCIYSDTVYLNLTEKKTPKKVNYSHVLGQFQEHSDYRLNKLLSIICFLHG